MVRKDFLLRLVIPMIIIGMLASCTGKSGNSSSKKSSASDYPIVEISEGLAKAAPAYSQVYEFHGGYAMVRGGESYGLIDKNGKLVVPCDYASLTAFDKVLLVTKSLYSQTWGVIDIHGNVIVPLKYGEKDIVVFPKEGVVRIKNSDCEYDFYNFEGKKLFNNSLYSRKMGLFFDQSGVIISEGLACAVFDRSDLYHNPYGFVDKTGTVVIPARFQNPARFDNGLAWIDKSLINTKGEVVMEVKQEGSLMGLIKPDGTEVVPCQFKKLDVFENGLIVTQGVNNLYGIWNILEGKEVVAPMYNAIEYHLSDYYNSSEEVIGWYSDEGGHACRRFIKNGLIEVQKGNRYGVIDTNGKEILPCEYERSYYIRIGENSIVTTIDVTSSKSIHSLYSLDGKEIMAERESIMNQMSEGLVAVMKDDGSHCYGYYDENGDEVIAPKYGEAGLFSEGLAPVQLKSTGQWGYVNHAGQDTFGE